MRLLITGASGLLGLNLALDASSTSKVIGVDRHPPISAPFQVIQADLLAPNAVRRILEESKPEAVIHCAAAADVDFCENNPGLAWQTNAELPARIAEDCAVRNVNLIHISTDAVFDGHKSGSYAESDEPSPVGVYAATKYEGEQAVLRVNPLATVVRVNFYGWSITGRRSLAEFFVTNLSLGRSVIGFDDVSFCPMLVNHLGETLIKMLKANLHGLYHVVGAEPMTKYQFGVEIAHKFGLDANLISPASVDHSALTARRSHNLRLSIHKLSTDLGSTLPNFSTGLDKFYSQFEQGYPQRIRSYQQEGPRVGSTAGASHRI
jgi:dTDP-4-dehydrorhamnose reductase